jgi:hypothetical protein
LVTDVADHERQHFDDLQTIVGHALAWERKLLTRAG